MLAEAWPTSCCSSIGASAPPSTPPLHSKWRKSLRDLKGFIKFVNSTKSRAALPAHVLTPDSNWFQGHCEFKHYMAAIRSSGCRLPSCRSVAALQRCNIGYALPIRQAKHANTLPALLAKLSGHKFFFFGHLTADDLCACLLRPGQAVCTSVCICFCGLRL